MPLSRNPKLLLVFVLLTAQAAPAAATADLRAHLGGLQSVTAACAFESGNCDPDRIGPDDTVGNPKQPGGYVAQWAWLRDAIRIAAKAKPEDRTRNMRGAQAHLNAMAAQLDAAAKPDHFDRAQLAVQQTLSRDEFHTAAPTSWWDRQKARLRNWLARAFNGLDDFSSNKPWLGHTLEALFFLAAVIGLLLFVRQQLAQQRMRVALNTPTARMTGWARESTAWSTLAEQRAAESDCREAIHCLFWAAIVLLEGRRTWRHDPSRTPREYVRLLHGPQREHLRALAALFERTWYGLRAATPADYDAARGSFTALESARGIDPDARSTDAPPAEARPA